MAEDKSSWRGRAVHRRNERQTAVPEIRPPSGSKKDTKKWCRGKVGVAHKPVCVAYDEHKRTNLRVPEWKILLCSECKKELDYYWPSPFRWHDREPEPPPAWVTGPIT